MILMLTGPCNEDLTHCWGLQGRTLFLLQNIDCWCSLEQPLNEEVLTSTHKVSFGKYHNFSSDNCHLAVKIAVYYIGIYM